MAVRGREGKGQGLPRLELLPNQSQFSLLETGPRFLLGSLCLPTHIEIYQIQSPVSVALSLDTEIGSETEQIWSKGSEAMDLGRSYQGQMFPFLWTSTWKTRAWSCQERVCRHGLPLSEAKQREANLWEEQRPGAEDVPCGPGLCLRQFEGLFPYISHLQEEGSQFHLKLENQEKVEGHEFQFGHVERGALGSSQLAVLERQRFGSLSFGGESFNKPQTKLQCSERV